MTATHKYSRSHIAIDGALTPRRLAELTQHVAENAAGTAKVRFEGAEPGQTNFSVRSWNGFAELMTFHVSIRSSGDRTIATSSIEEFKTTQQTIYFIPVAPKQLLGYSAYKKFMHSLAAAVRSEDPEASVHIIERPARV